MGAAFIRSGATWLGHGPVKLLLFLLASILLTSPAKSQVVVPTNFTESGTSGLAFEQPVGVAWDANGRQYVWEKGGKVWIVDNGALLPTPLIDIGEEVGNWRDHGMLGFALDPNFLVNGRFYLSYVVDRHHLMNFGTGAYSASANDYYSASIIRITRYTATGPGLTTTSLASRTILLGATPQTGAPLLHESHGAGTLVFGSDGTLMATIGDNASYFGYDLGNAWETYYFSALVDGILRPNENVGAMRSQMVESLCGKLLRLDPNTGNGVPSNPWYDAAAPGATRSKVWALGLRNPYRMTRKPGSGSTNPADGDPGVFYIGDVGLDSWEEQNVCTDAGMNFGWPLFEGLTAHTEYMAALTPNYDEPNPNYNGASCNQQYFYFQDLLKQDTRQLLNNHPMPCNTSTQIPLSVPTFLHARPSIDYLHGYRSRAGGFNGNTAVTFDLDDPLSPVPGPRFGGNAALAGPYGVWPNFPITYKNSAYHGDYGQGWIRRLTYDANDQVASVHNFAYGLGPITWLNAGPDGCIWYIKYDGGQVRKICYTGTLNLPPTALATQNVQYGPGPLTVNFTGSGSTDPENMPLTYAWNFGNGTSAVANPTQVFTSPAGVATTYNVTLTVTDNIGQSAMQTLIVSVNNTPPVVNITSIPIGALYPVGVDTVFQLNASVTDAEHPAAGLNYAWRTTLFHNTHVHPEPLDNNVSSSTVISGVGCGTEPFYYKVGLTVTDGGGLSGYSERTLMPNCAAIGPVALISSSVSVGLGPLIVAFDGSGSYDPGTIVSYLWDFGDGTTSGSQTPSKTFSQPGEYMVRLTVVDDDGLTGTATRSITVLALVLPQCVGASGSITREFWNNINGISVLDLLNNPNYPNNPSGTSFPTELAGPINAGNNYGQRLRGYIVAPETGTYVFTATGDDQAAVYLGLNSDPQFKRLICSVPVSTTYTGFFDRPEQTSAPITLQAGAYYYVEVLHKEGSGADFVALWWQTPSNGTRVVVPGPVLARWQDCGPSVKLKANLQGPWNEATNQMKDDLRTGSLLPNVEPYGAAGYTLVGSGGETLPGSMLAVSGTNAIVDWVLVELRNKLNSAQIVATKSALLQKDGDIVGTDGYSRLLFNVPADEYFVALRHRNHLAVMTSTAKALSGQQVSIDLTLPSEMTYGNNARVALPNGKLALRSGNVINDGRLQYTGVSNDRDPILVSIGGVVATNVVVAYSNSDVNMDGEIKYTGEANDRDPILINIGGTVPTTVLLEQLP